MARKEISLKVGDKVARIKVDLKPAKAAPKSPSDDGSSEESAERPYDADHRIAQRMVADKGEAVVVGATEKLGNVFAPHLGLFGLLRDYGNAVGGFYRSRPAAWGVR
jgi:hypothetical protein